MAGATAGGAIGHAGGSMFGEVGAYAGAAVGALSGFGTGRYTADIVATKSDQKFENALQWYAQTGGLSLDEASQRLRNL